MNIINLKQKSNELTLIQEHTQRIWNCSVVETSNEPIHSWVLQLDPILTEHGFNTDAIDVAIVTGCTTSNGHALLHSDTGIAWVSVSSYPTQKTIEIFVTHEIIHALHYQMSPEFAFSTQEQKNHVGRQLITEGIATYITKQLLGTQSRDALWADYLESPELDSLMNEYELHLSKSAGALLQQWDNADADFFYSRDRKNVDAYRSGYYVGLVITEIVMKERQLSFSELLSAPRTQLEELFKEQLHLLSLAA